jgi:inosine-uridine nucleoside N-ribohydrolase
VPVLVDTDIGDYLDDALALALLLSSPEIDLAGVTTVTGDSHTRALIVCRWLHFLGRADVAVAAGQPPQEPPEFRGQMQYGLRPAFRKRPERDNAVAFLHRQLKARPGELTLLALGPLTNIADLFTRYPESKAWVKRIVLMGGSLRVGYEGRPPAVPEWNIKADIKAAQVVFTSGVPLVVAPLDATVGLLLDESRRQRVFAARTPLTDQLEALYQLSDRPTPTLFDPVAAALCFEEKFCRMEPLRLEVDDKGHTREVQGKPNARVVISIVRNDFLDWYVDRIAPRVAAIPAPAKKPANPSTVVPRGAFPDRVHVIEDYETQIERRWWLCGVPEMKNVPAGSTRACRGVLTNDFDDLMGDAKGMYTAVILNPVPGPPMGQKTHLGFRYWLKGTDTLRVQIYTLTRGYHRHLSLTGLPQGRWQEATVDMTAARRPDGSGDRLSEDERIDDIQFYADRGADLLIDDIVLYDAAAPNETRPFPRRLVFTGWFDTGRQGKEWPGHFDIVAKEKPLTWKAARSVANPDTGLPWIRLQLRGERPLGETTHLHFRYRLTGAAELRVELANRTARQNYAIDLKGLKAGTWAEATLDFSTEGGGARKPRPGDRVDEVRFRLPPGAELLLDDVLLYEPGT